MTYNSKYLFSLWVFGVQLNFGDQVTHIWGLAACQPISDSLSWDEGNLAVLRCLLSSSSLPGARSHSIIIAVGGVWPHPVPFALLLPHTPHSSLEH